MKAASLNAAFSTARMRRRYEVWFVRLGLTDGSGAWWFRYLVMNLGRSNGGCPGNPRGMPVQVWATWFPRDAAPRSFIQGYSAERLSLTPRKASPFRLKVAGNRIGEDFCAGRLETGGHAIAWDLRSRSTLAVTLSDKGWIGFSRTPHSDAVFNGEITFDSHRSAGEPLGYGLQGHNCGYRHRRVWSWAHAIVLDPHDSGMSTFEALEHNMPFGLRFRKALLRYGAKLYTFPNFRPVVRDRENLKWVLECSDPSEGTSLRAVLDGSGISAHRLAYLKTDCSGCFEVANNSLARAHLYFSRQGKALVELRTEGGAVVEMAGD